MISREINIQLTSKELATEFCNMDSNEQAIFFNTIYAISKTWNRSFCFQFQDITNSDRLSNDGRAIMKSIGEYSEKNIMSS